jgi:SWI/SNF-related matrix-associated actin-dependent regulator of chromatin subfamily A3
LHRNEDQRRIRTAVTNRHIDPADVPESAKTIDLTALENASAPLATQGKGKRKADNTAGQSTSLPSSSQPGSSQPSSSQPRASQRYGTNSLQGDVIEIDDDEDVDNGPEEVKDELYCMLKTNVVGIQYYK